MEAIETYHWRSPMIIEPSQLSVLATSSLTHICAPGPQWIRRLSCVYCHKPCLVISYFIYIIELQLNAPMTLIVWRVPRQTCARSVCLDIRRWTVARAQVTQDDGTLIHYDVIKWKTNPCYWRFVRGIHRSPVVPWVARSPAAMTFEMQDKWVRVFKEEWCWLPAPYRGREKIENANIFWCFLR